MIYGLPLPGWHTADASVWTGIVTMLAALNFNAIKDKNGNDVEFEAKFASGVTQWVLMVYITCSWFLKWWPVTHLPSLVTSPLVYTLLKRLSNILLWNDGTVFHWRFLLWLKWRRLKVNRYITQQENISKTREYNMIHGVLYTILHMVNMRCDVSVSGMW